MALLTSMRLSDTEVSKTQKVVARDVGLLRKAEKK